MTVERWWKHAVVVDVPMSAGEGSPTAALQGMTERLDELRGMGVDALLLRGAGDVTTGGAGADGDRTSGEAMDELIAQASRRGMRVLVELRGDLPGTELASTARMWLNRGVAGLDVAGGGDDATRVVRGAMREVHGERLLVSGGASASASGRAMRGEADVQEVRIDGFGAQAGAAATLRHALEAMQGERGEARAVLLSAEDLPGAGSGSGPVSGPGSGSGSGSGDELSRVRAAVALLSEPVAALLDERTFGAPAAGPLAAGGAGSASVTATPPDEHSVAAQVRQMSDLHHDRAAFLVGATTLLDHDAEGAAVWLRRGPGGAVIVVLCNVSSQPVRLSLTGDMAQLHLRGTFLKTVSRSDSGLGGMPLDAVAVPGFGVYVGELAR